MLFKFKKQFIEKGELYLRVKVKPGAAESKIREIMADGTIKIDIAAPPVRGRANNELIAFLASAFTTARKNVKIISGAAERIKLIKIINGHQNR